MIEVAGPSSAGEWQEDELVPIASLNQYAYCPRRCYYIYVAEEYEDNIHTLEGSYLHENVHQASEHLRGEKIQVRSVTLYSGRYGLTGKADLVEIEDGQVYPVEYKKGRRGDWQNDQIQLCAQAMVLEEVTGRAINHGYVFYASDKRRQVIEFTPELRAETLQVIQAVRELLTTRRRPPQKEGPRCQGCSLKDICLPSETRRILSYGEEEQ